MSRICGGSLRGQRVLAGAADASLTANAGLAAVTELCGRLGVIDALDTAVGPIKRRDRGFGAGELLCGIAAAQLAGEDFLTGLDRQRADIAGQQICPVPGLASTTTAGLARRITPAQWALVPSRDQQARGKAGRVNASEPLMTPRNRQLREMGCKPG